MSIQSEINRISGNVANALTAIANKGVTVPAGSNSDNLADLIGQISGGITPTGNINITQAGATDVTNYATATVPSGALVSTLFVSVSPTISVDDDGLVAASGEGYASESIVYQTGWIEDSSTLVVYKTAYAQQQLPTQAATTITPSTTAQTAVAKGKWTTGAVTVAAMPSGTAGTPTATKGTVSNHAVTVTPSVTNTTGYITGGTRTGTGVTVTASELVSGSQTVTQNGPLDCTNLAEIVVAVEGGGGGMSVATATATPSTASSSIQFTGLAGEPTSFVVTSASDLATGASPYKTAAVVFDGTDLHGQIVTNTSNAQASYSTSFSKSYSNGTLTITGSGTNFQANQYKLVYTHGGNSANIGTAETQVGSGATSVAFTGLTDEPDYFSVIFKSNFGTSSGYQRVMSVAYDGTNTYGVAMDSGAKALSSWSYTYSNGTLTVSSVGTNNGGYFHQPGYYQLTYGVGGTVEPTEIEVEPLNVTTNGTYTAPDGKAYSPVTVNVSGGGGANIDTKTVTASNYPTSISFSSMKGTPKAFFLRSTSQISSSGNTTYYYVTDLVYDGNSSNYCDGNCFRIGSTRRVEPITTTANSGYTWSYSGTTLTITSSAASRSASPGSFNNGYELVYIY